MRSRVMPYRHSNKQALTVLPDREGGPPLEAGERFDLNSLQILLAAGGPGREFSAARCATMPYYVAIRKWIDKMA